MTSFKSLSTCSNKITKHTLRWDRRRAGLQVVGGLRRSLQRAAAVSLPQVRRQQWPGMVPAQGLVRLQQLQRKVLPRLQVGLGRGRTGRGQRRGQQQMWAFVSDWARAREERGERGHPEILGRERAQGQGRGQGRGVQEAWEPREGDRGWSPQTTSARAYGARYPPAAVTG
jgi:hypothetical protein